MPWTESKKTVDISKLIEASWIQLVSDELSTHFLMIAQFNRIEFNACQQHV